MRVLSIDPGYDRLGLAVLELVAGKEVLLYSTCIETKKTDPLPDRLLTLGQAFANCIAEQQPTCVALETLFFNTNQKTGIGVAQARGILIYLAKSSSLDVYEFGPQEVKIAVTGYGKSDKGAVIDMVKRLVPDVPHKALDDEYDAIAVGITCLAHHGRGG